MEKISKIKEYEKAILTILRENADESLEGDDYKKMVIADTISQHYQLLATGWFNNHFSDNILVHFQIKPDGKIWLWENNTIAFRRY